MSETPAAQLARIREILHPTDETYEAEPLDIEDARWLLAEVDSLRALYREELQRRFEAAGLKDVSVGPSVPDIWS